MVNAMINDEYLNELAGDSWRMLAGAPVIGEGDVDVKDIGRDHHMLWQRCFEYTDSVTGADTDANEAAWD